MFGKVRWLASPALLLMVAIFTVQFTCGLFLESTRKPEYVEVEKCMDKYVSDNDMRDCYAKAAKEDFAEVKNDFCQDEFGAMKCKAAMLCKFCNQANFANHNELFFRALAQILQNLTANQCKEWESKVPVIPTVASCSEGGPKSGGFISDHGGLLGTIVVVVALVVAGVIGMVLYRKGKSPSAQPGKVSKSSSSTTATSSKTADSSKGGKSSKLALK